jgi:hypothetical protein
VLVQWGNGKNRAVRLWGSDIRVESMRRRGWKVMEQLGSEAVWKQGSGTSEQYEQRREYTIRQWSCTAMEQLDSRIGRQWASESSGQ